MIDTYVTFYLYHHNPLLVRFSSNKNVSAFCGCCCGGVLVLPDSPNGLCLLSSIGDTNVRGLSLSATGDASVLCGEGGDDVDDDRDEDSDE